MKKELKSMIQFILDIDWLSTKEFCDTYGVPHPRYTGEVESSANQFLQVDAVKHRMFVEYAKFLNQRITIEMFQGDNPLFKGYEVQDDEKFIKFYSGIRVYEPSSDPYAWSYVFRKGEPIPQIKDLVGKIKYYTDLTIPVSEKPLSEGEKIKSASRQGANVT